MTYMELQKIKETPAAISIGNNTTHILWANLNCTNKYRYTRFNFFKRIFTFFFGFNNKYNKNYRKKYT